MSIRLRGVWIGEVRRRYVEGLAAQSKRRKLDSQKNLKYPGQPRDQYGRFASSPSSAPVGGGVFGTGGSVAGGSGSEGGGPQLLGEGNRGRVNLHEANYGRVADVLGSHQFIKSQSPNEPISVNIFASGELKADVSRRVGRRVRDKLTAELGEQEARQMLKEFGDDLDTSGFYGWKAMRDRGGDEFENATSAIVGSWAESSTSELALIVQKRAKAKFGLEGTRDIEFRAKGKYAEHKKQHFQMMQDRYGKVFDAFADATYEETQSYLESAGVDKLLVYRGMHFDQDKKPGWLSNIEQNGKTMGSGSQAGGIMDEFGFSGPKPKYVESAKMGKSNPVSSYSTDYNVARDFALYGTRGSQGAVVAVEIPREQIFSLPTTGMGCVNENEVIAMPGNQNVRILTAEKGKLDFVSENDFWGDQA